MLTTILLVAAPFFAVTGLCIGICECFVRPALERWAAGFKACIEKAIK